VRFGDQIVIDDGLVNGSAAHHRLAGVRGDAVRAVGIPVSLRVRDDPGIGLLSGVDRVADMTFDGSLLFAVDLAAHRRRLRRAGPERAHRRREMAVLIVSGLTVAFSVPLYASFRTGTAAMQFVAACAVDFDHSFGVLHRGGRHFDALIRC